MGAVELSGKPDEMLGEEGGGGGVNFAMAHIPSRGE